MAIEKKTPIIKGFTINSKKVNGHLILNKEFIVDFIEDTSISNPVTSRTSTSSVTEVSIIIAQNQVCPKCKKGNIIKGKAAFGCNRYKEGCDFRVAF